MVACAWAGSRSRSRGCTVGNLVFKRIADQSVVASTQVLNGSTWIPAKADIGSET